MQDYISDAVTSDSYAQTRHFKNPCYFSTTSKSLVSRPMNCSCLFCADYSNFRGGKVESFRSERSAADSNAMLVEEARVSWLLS